MDIASIVNLCTVENMSLAELYEDPQFNKIPKDKIIDYINGSSRIAKMKAARVKSENKNINLIDICKSKGVTVNIVNKDYSVMNVHYRAEIYYDKKIINIMKTSVTQMYAQLKNLNLCDGKYNLSVESITDIHIAHELYHLIENMDGEETGSLLPKVTRIKIGKLEKKSEIVRTSEAAAHIFCMEILDLPFHPKLLDYLYLAAVGEVAELRLLEFLQSIQTHKELIKDI